MAKTAISKVYATYKKMYKAEIKKGWVVKKGADSSGGINKMLNFKQFKTEYEIERMNLKESYAEDTARKGKNPTSTQVMRQMISDAKTETEKESASGYDNLKRNVAEINKKIKAGESITETEKKVLEIVKRNGGLKGKLRWRKSGGGNIYKELRALGVADEGLGSL